MAEQSLSPPPPPSASSVNINNNNNNEEDDAASSSASTAQPPTVQELAQAFATQGLTDERVTAMPFQVLRLALCETQLVETCKALVTRLLALSAPPPPPPLLPTPFNARIFLTMYFIVFRTRNVFETNGPLEQRLYAACVQLHGTFGAVMRALLSTSTSTTTCDGPLLALFRDHVAAMRRAFDEWKGPDERKLTQRIVRSLMALYEAQRRLISGDDEPMEEEERPAAGEEGDGDRLLRANMDAQIARLRDKLVQIGGRVALDEFDAQRLTGLVVFNGTGMHETATAAATTVDSEHNEPMHERLAHELLLDPEFVLVVAEEEPQQQPEPQQLQLQLQATQQSSINNLDDAFWEALLREDLMPMLEAEVQRAMASGSVRLLSIIMPSYSDDDTATASAENAAATTTPLPLLVRLSEVLRRIHEGVAALFVTTTNNNNGTALHDVVYVEVLRRLGATRRVEFRMIERALVMTEQVVRSRTLHAPLHEAEQAEWFNQWKVAYDALLAADRIDSSSSSSSSSITTTTTTAAATAMRGALRQMLRWVNRLSIDETNNRLRLIVNVVQEHGIDYERRKFEARLQNGSTSTVATRALVARILARHNATDELPILARSGHPRAVHEIHRSLILHVLFACFDATSSSSSAAKNSEGEEEDEEEVVPEILHLDHDRLRGMHDELGVLLRRATAATAAVDAVVVGHMTAAAAEAEIDEGGEEVLVVEEQLRRIHSGIHTALVTLVMRAFHGGFSCVDEALAFVRRKKEEEEAEAEAEEEAFSSRVTMVVSELMVPPVLELVERLTVLAALNRSVHQATLATLVHEEAWRMLGDEEEDEDEEEEA